MNVKVEDLNCELEKADIEANYFVKVAEKQIPGFFTVKVENCLAHHENFELFGIDNPGKEVSGTGVKPTKTIYDKQDNLVLHFAIDKLTDNNQFNENSKEIVLKVAGQELGRDQINTESSVHIG